MEQREILFRGQKTGTKEWLFGGYAESADGKTGYIFPKGTDHSFEVIKETVTQYIGIKDEKDVKIFEGDIVRFCHVDEIEYNDDEIILNHDNWQTSIVDYGGVINGDFDSWSTWTIRFAMNADYEFEIIGNKFENPELLEEA